MNTIKENENLKSDNFITSIEFLREASKCAPDYWKRTINAIINKTSPDQILENKIPIAKSTILSCLEDETICENWKNEIRKEFQIVLKDYFEFGQEFIINMNVLSKPIAIGHGAVADDERGKCLIINTSNWETEITDFKQGVGDKFIKIKFKKK